MPKALNEHFAFMKLTYCLPITRIHVCGGPKENAVEKPRARSPQRAIWGLFLLRPASTTGAAPIPGAYREPGHGGQRVKHEQH